MPHLLTIGDRVKMTTAGAKWATSKKSRTMGINWYRRAGTVERFPLDRTLAFVIWDGTVTGKPTPKIFLRPVRSTPMSNGVVPCNP